MKELPSGYVQLKNVAVHMATLRRFTPDPERFMRMVKYVDQLSLHEPESDAARAIYQEVAMAGDIDALSLTLRECADIELTLAEEIKSGESPEQPPIYLNTMEDF